MQAYIISVGWVYRISQIYLFRRVRAPHPKEYPGYNTKQSDFKALVLAF